MSIIMTTILPKTTATRGSLSSLLLSKMPSSSCPIRFSSFRRTRTTLSAAAAKIPTSIVGNSNPSVTAVSPSFSSSSWRRLKRPSTSLRFHYTYASGPGYFGTTGEEELLELWKSRDFEKRGFTVGIGGPVGSGKTALVYKLCQHFSSSSPAVNTRYDVAVVTNDIFTQEDAEFLIRNRAFSGDDDDGGDDAHVNYEDRIRAVETGGCPHAAIREDVSSNVLALEDLTAASRERAGSSSSSSSSWIPPLLLCESGGDNLAANFSRELADLTLYVIDVAGGDKVPRKGGPGITQSDLLVINKIDLAPAVGADLSVMKRDARRMRRRRMTDRGGAHDHTHDHDHDGDHDHDHDHDDNAVAPMVFASVKNGEGFQEIVDFIVRNYEKAMAISTQTVDK